MVVSGLLQTGSRTEALWLQREEWPAYKIQVTSLVAVGLLMAIYLATLRFLGVTACPRWDQAKWVFLRAGCSGIGNFLNVFVVVVLGTPMGDAAALSSINTVVAALVGRAFLKEPLRRAHLVGLLCSLTGACMIGFSSAHTLSRSAFLGYPLAVLAGCAQAFQLIFARKSQGLPAQLLSLAGLIALSSVTAISLATGIVKDFEMDKVEDQPWQAVLWVVTLGCFYLFSTTCNCMGGMMCPAGMGATLLTGAGMVSSYAVQAFLFGESVQPLSLAGAFLMLASMAIMSAFRAKPPEEKVGQTDESQTGASHSAADGKDRESTDDDTESLHSFASFISREFASETPSEGSLVVQRRVSKCREDLHRTTSSSSNVPDARTFGSAVRVAV